MPWPRLHSNTWGVMSWDNVIQVYLLLSVFFLCFQSDYSVKGPEENHRTRFLLETLRGLDNIWEIKIHWSDPDLNENQGGFKEDLESSPDRIEDPQGRRGGWLKSDLILWTMNRLQSNFPFLLLIICISWRSNCRRQCNGPDRYFHGFRTVHTVIVVFRVIDKSNCSGPRHLSFDFLPLGSSSVSLVVFPLSISSSLSF